MQTANLWRDRRHSLVTNDSGDLSSDISPISRGERMCIRNMETEASYDSMLLARLNAKFRFTSDFLQRFVLF